MGICHAPSPNLPASTDAPGTGQQACAGQEIIWSRTVPNHAALSPCGDIRGVGDGAYPVASKGYGCIARCLRSGHGNAVRCVEGYRRESTSACI